MTLLATEKRDAPATPGHPHLLSIARILGHLKRVVIVLCVFALTRYYQDWRRESAEKAAVAWMTDKLQEWESSHDAVTRGKLHDQMESRMKEIRHPADLVNALPPRYLDTFVANESFDTWWNTDPHSLLAWMAAQANPPRFQLARSLRALSERPEEASSYLATLSSGPWKEKVLQTLAQDDILASSPQEAIALLTRMQEGETRQTLLKSALFEWSENDFDGAVGWLDLVGDAALKRSLLEPLALGHAASDQHAALLWLARLEQPIDNVAPAIRSVMDRWIAEDSPADAAATVQALPDGPAREAALEELIRVWRQSDPRAAAGWVSALPPDALRVSASRVFQTFAPGNGEPVVIRDDRKLTNP